MKNNYVMATYFVHTPDPQRNRTWNANIDDLMPLINSVIKFNHKVIIFHDCFREVPILDGCEWVFTLDDISDKYTSSVVRWFRYNNYFENNFEKINAAFMVDSTDVELLVDPFDKLDNNTLYAGDEYSKNAIWLKGRNSKFNPPDYDEVIDPIKNELLLNAGIVGGHSSVCMEFLSTHTKYHGMYNTAGISKSFDMPAFNYTIWKHFKNRLIHGSPVNTRFKKYEYDYNNWWKHK